MDDQKPYIYIYTYIHTPSGSLWYNIYNYRKSPLSMGKSTISMAIFNSYVSLPEGTTIYHVTLTQTSGPYSSRKWLDLVLQNRVPRLWGARASNYGLRGPQNVERCPIGSIKWRWSIWNCIKPKTWVRYGTLYTSASMDPFLGCASLFYLVRPTCWSGLAPFFATGESKDTYWLDTQRIYVSYPNISVAQDLIFVVKSPISS